MSDSKTEFREYVVTPELVIEFKMAEMEKRATFAEFENAQLKVALSQQNAKAAEEKHAALVKRLTTEITEDGIWDVVTQDWNTGKVTLKLSAAGKAKREAENAKSDAS